MEEAMGRVLKGIVDFFPRINNPRSYRGTPEVFIDAKSTHDGIRRVVTSAEDPLHSLFDTQTLGAKGEGVIIQSGTNAVGITFRIMAGN